MRRIYPALLLTTLLTLNACERSKPDNTTNADDPGVSWVRVDVDALTGQQAAQRARAIEARNELASTLKGELMDAIQSKGPVHAIEVCHTRAPQIATDVARSEGVRIGRTSQRLRNDSNVAPSWMSQVVDENSPELNAFAATDGALAVAYPIMLENACVMCHGSDEQVPAAVRAEIDERYPSDRARGYAPGDLRGWFWVEVPPEG